MIRPPGRQQEPALDEGKTVLGNVQEGVAETKDLMERYNEIPARLAAEYSDELPNGRPSGS